MFYREFFAACLLTCLIKPAYAHPVKTQNTKPLQVTVYLDRYGTLTAPSTWEAIQEIRKIPGGAAVVPAEKFKDGYALSMKDMLAATPGVFAQPRWGEESRLSIRGSGLSRSFHVRGIALLQDGIPFNFADGSGDFQEIDPLIQQHVEVYRGGQALRYGAATLGGAVNLVTPTAKMARHNTLFRFEGGSFKTLRTHIQAAQRFDESDIFTAATRSISDGYRLQSEQNNTRFNGNIGIALGAHAETRFYVGWNDIAQEVPGTISKQNALHNPKTVPSVNILNDYARDLRSLRLANKTVFALHDGLMFEVGGYVNDKSLYHPIFQVLDQESRDLGLFSRISGPWEVAGKNNDFVLGVNLTYGVNDADRYVNVGGNRGALTADTKQIAKNLDVYGENTLHFLQSWSLISGFQGSLSDRAYADRLNPDNDADKIFRSFNLKLGTLWRATPKTEIYASLTRSSEVPTFSELVQGAVPGFVPVDLQKAWTAELGTRGAYGNFSWDATLYHARIEGEMLQFNVGPDVPASTFNADKTVHQGIELGLSWQAWKPFGFQVTYNLNDFSFDDDRQFGDNELAGAPLHQIRVSARYEDDALHIEPSVEWVPESGWVDYANTLRADSYAIFSVKAGWEVTKNVSLFLDARNLTDKRFISSYSTLTDARTAGNTNVFYPGDGRGVFGGLRVKF